MVITKSDVGSKQEALNSAITESIKLNRATDIELLFPHLKQSAFPNIPLVSYCCKLQGVSVGSGGLKNQGGSCAIEVQCQLLFMFS